MIQYFPRSLSRIKYCSSPWNITLDRTETKKLRNNNITRYGNLNSSLVSVLRYILIYGREKKNDVKSVYLGRENSEDVDGDSPIPYEEYLVKTCLIATIKRGKEAGSDSVENDDPIGVMTRDHRDKWARDTCHTWRNNTNITKDGVYQYEAENVLHV